MYKRILVPLENTATDAAILEHVRRPATCCKSSVVPGGDPSEEITAAAEREHCDLIAMSTHGHRFVKDLLFGSVANEVRHRASVPVLCVRARVPHDVPAASPPPAS